MNIDGYDLNSTLAEMNIFGTSSKKRMATQHISLTLMLVSKIEAAKQ